MSERLRLLRRLDVEEVLADLGLGEGERRGSDVYYPCPDPEHVDGKPSFHVCVEEVIDKKGRNRLGWFNCWSHPPGLRSMRGQDLLELIARARAGSWRRDVLPEERAGTLAWLRTTFLGEAGDVEERVLRRRTRARVSSTSGVLPWPLGVPVAGAPEEVRAYLARRGVPLSRSVDLGVRFVEGAELPCLRETAPAVVFPIHRDGAVVNWYARATWAAPSKSKGRYAPGVPLTSAGVLWLPDETDPTGPLALVEGIFDAERVRALLLNSCQRVSHRNVGAVLGGLLHPAQARRLRSFPEVVVLADGDAGGAGLAASVEAQLGKFLRVTVRMMPDGSDPGDAPPSAVLAALARPVVAPAVRIRYRTARR